MTSSGSQEQSVSDTAAQEDARISAAFEEMRRRSDAQAVSVFDRGDRELIRRLLIRLIRVRLWLSIWDYPALRKKIEAKVIVENSDKSITSSEIHFALRAGRIVNGLGRRMPFASECLVRSLAVWWLLRERGIPAELTLGVKKDDVFEAHAWVNVCGQPISDTHETITDFHAFDRSAH